MGIWDTGLQQIRTELLPAGQAKRFSTSTIIPEVEVDIDSKMTHNTYALDPYESVSKGKGVY